MVLSPSLQVSDSQIKDQVRKDAAVQQMLHKLPTLLGPEEDPWEVQEELTRIHQDNQKRKSRLIRQSIGGGGGAASLKGGAFGLPGQIAPHLRKTLTLPEGLDRNAGPKDILLAQIDLQKKEMESSSFNFGSLGLGGGPGGIGDNPTSSMNMSTTTPKKQLNRRASMVGVKSAQVSGPGVAGGGGGDKDNDNTKSQVGRKSTYASSGGVAPIGGGGGTSNRDQNIMSLTEELRKKYARRGTIVASNLDRSCTIPTGNGRRVNGAIDNNIDLFVQFPRTGDIIKMQVEQNIPLSQPQTPMEVRNNRFLNFWGNDADDYGYTGSRSKYNAITLAEQERNNNNIGTTSLGDTLNLTTTQKLGGSKKSSLLSGSNSEPNLKTELSKLTGLPRKELRLVHPQSRMVFKGPDSLADLGICHGQTLQVLHLAPLTSAAMLKKYPEQKERLEHNKMLKTMSSAMKKPRSDADSNPMIKLAKEQTSQSRYKVIPRWNPNGFGVKMCDLKGQMAESADPTIFFHDYSFLPDAGKTMSAVAMIRETFEKKRSYMNKRQLSLVNATKLASSMRILMGKEVPIKDLFNKWKEVNLEDRKKKQEFEKDAGFVRSKKQTEKDTSKMSKDALNRRMQAQTKTLKYKNTQDIPLPNVYAVDRQYKLKRANAALKAAWYDSQNNNNSDNDSNGGGSITPRAVKSTVSMSGLGAPGQGHGGPPAPINTSNSNINLTILPGTTIASPKKSHHGASITNTIISPGPPDDSLVNLANAVISGTVNATLTQPGSWTNEGSLAKMTSTLATTSCISPRTSISNLTTGGGGGTNKKGSILISDGGGPNSTANKDKKSLHFQADQFDSSDNLNSNNNNVNSTIGPNDSTGKMGGLSLPKLPTSDPRISFGESQSNG